MTAIQEQRAAWLAEARQKAWADFKRLPPPAKTVETWRRVDFSQWRTDQLARAVDGSVTPAKAYKFVIPAKAGIHHMDPRFRGGDDLRSRRNDAQNIPLTKGVIFMSLEQAAAQHPRLVEPYLKNLSTSLDFRLLEAANLSQFQGGYFLYIPKGLRVEKPLELTFVHAPENPFDFPRVLAIVEETAEVTIVESHYTGTINSLQVQRSETSPSPSPLQGEGRRISSIAFSRLVIGPNAKVRYFYDQALSLNTVHFWHQQAELGSGAVLQHYSTLLGSVLHKSELDVQLKGPGARSELYGILLGSRNQQFDPHTAQWHRQPKTSSDLLFRTALKGRARSVYTGLIRIEKEAAACDAFQQNNNLLLSNEARADSTPILEILTNEVHCKHGATVGPVNEDELFYLCSRGLPPDEAAKMLVLGFFDPILSKLPLDHQKERIVREIEARLS